MTETAIDPLVIARERGRAEGFAEARADVGDCWCPVPIRWRLVAVGDAIIGPGDGRIWIIRQLIRNPASGMLRPIIQRDGEPVEPRDKAGNLIWFDPDAQVHILEKVTMLDAMKVHREELGARVMGGRET